MSRWQYQRLQDISLAVRQFIYVRVIVSLLFVLYLAQLSYFTLTQLTSTRGALIVGGLALFWYLVDTAIAARINSLEQEASNLYEESFEYSPSIYKSKLWHHRLILAPSLRVGAVIIGFTLITIFSVPPPPKGAKTIEILELQRITDASETIAANFDRFMLDHIREGAIESTSNMRQRSSTISEAILNDLYLSMVQPPFYNANESEEMKLQSAARMCVTALEHFDKLMVGLKSEGEPQIEEVDLNRLRDIRREVNSITSPVPPYRHDIPGLGFSRVKKIEQVKSLLTSAVSGVEKGFSIAESGFSIKKPAIFKLVVQLSSSSDFIHRCRTSV